MTFRLGNRQKLKEGMSFSNLSIVAFHAAKVLFVYVFFCPFSILITLLGEEEAGLCAYRAFVC